MTQAETMRDLDAEEALLGAAIVSYDTLGLICEKVTPDWFGFNDNALIFRALQHLFEQSATQDIDLKMVSDRMQRTHTLPDAGGAEKLAHVKGCAAAPSRVSYFMDRVEEFWRRRRIFALGSSMSDRVTDEAIDLSVLMNDAEEAFHTLTDDAEGGMHTVESLLADIHTEAQDNSTRDNPLLGVSSGLEGLDEATAGFQPGDLVLLAARPSMGKTALALKIAQTVGAGTGVVFFSLEMSAKSLILRLLSSMCRIDGRRVRRGRMAEKEWSEVTRATSELSSLHLHIEDRSGISATAARHKVSKIQRQHEVGLVVIDYLQLMGTPGRSFSRNEEVTKVSQGLKALAKDCQVPVLALSQLSRGPDLGGQHRRPQLADLRDSGALEQDADIVLMLFHPAKVGEADAERNKCECIVAKQRNGPTGTVPLYWDETFARFDNWVRP